MDFDFYIIRNMVLSLCAVDLCSNSSISILLGLILKR